MQSLKAAANEKRIKVLLELQNRKKQTLSQLQKLLKTSKSTACYHLKVLEQVGLVKSERKKKKLYFLLNPKRVFRFNRKILKMIKQQRKR